MTLFQLILIVCAFGLLFWGFATYAPVPQPFKNICLLLIVVFCALILLNAAGVVSFGSLRVSELTQFRAMLA